MKYPRSILAVLGLLAVSACGPNEPPRAVSAVSSSNTQTLLPPRVKDRSEDGIQIVYPQVSIGFDENCDSFRVMSDQLNQCAKLPENVKSVAVEHCALFDKQALFTGNKTNFLHMTVSHFECE